MSRIAHGLVVVLLMGLAAGLLGWKSSRLAILYADGLRYVRQAQVLDQGLMVDGLFRSIDHPVYPAGIAAAHRLLGGNQPEDWVSSAQLVTVLCGTLLVLPLYLVAAELFGGKSAWIAVSLSYLTPMAPNLFADALSESTFLLFWTAGLWTALRFLREGRAAWIIPTIGFSALAYSTRPEGILLPAALALTVFLTPLLRTTRLNWRRWLWALGLLVVLPTLVAAPYVAFKGGLGTKPAIARLIGTASESNPEAVERNQPLDPSDSVPERYAKGAKAAFEALREAASIPGLALGFLGFAVSGLRKGRPRAALLLSIVLSASLAALIRLHSTSGYCSPRHAAVPTFLLLAASGIGLDWLLNRLSLPGSWMGQVGRVRPGPIFWLFAVAGFGALHSDRILEPINRSFVGYRLAADWLDHQVGEGEKVIDLTGWTQFYGNLTGYSFADAAYAGADQNARYVVAREAHVHGPWLYCRIIRNLIGTEQPIAYFPEHGRAEDARVYVFDRRIEGRAALIGSPDSVIR